MKKKKDLDQTAPLNQSVNNTSASDAHHRKVRSTALASVSLVLVLAIAGSLWWFLDYTHDDGLIYPNVYAYGINLGGMTPEEASAALHEATDSTYTIQNMTVQLPDSTLILSPADTKARVDVDRLVEMAYGYGREGNRWQNTQAHAAAELTSYELDTLSCLTLDQAYIRDVVDQIADRAASSLTESVVTVEGEVPDLNLTMEAAQAKTDVAHKQLTIRLGTPDRGLNTDALVEAILSAYCSNDFTPIIMEYDEIEPQSIDVAALAQEHTVLPVDAILDETDYSITPEILGYGFDEAALQALIDAAGEGETITLSFQYLPATVTKEALDATYFCDELGSVSTNHTNDSNRNTNLKLACKALNGVLVRPGETFSYNETLGKRTEEKGYKPAGAYAAGKSVETIGGGICQVSSTLYYACLKADLEIVERTAHGFTVSYMPYGMDATVSWGTLDFKFKNNTDYPIRIQASVSGGQVHVKLIGTDTKDYYVKMTYETIEGPTEGKVVYEDYPYNNEDGYKDGDVVQTAYTGRTVKSYRCKYDKETDELISKEYEATSRYKTRDKIIARVEAPPTESTEPSGQAGGQ